MHSARYDSAVALLGLLEREPSYGYELKQDTTAIWEEGRPLQFSQVYSTLGRFARDGKVTVGAAEPGAGPERKRYRITEAGAKSSRPGLRSRSSRNRTCRACCS